MGPQVRDLEGRERGAAHSEAQGKGERGQGSGIGDGVNTGKETEDLTWGYKMPQGQLLILEIRQKARKGRIVRWHQETVHK